MDERQQQIRERAGLEESRLNQDFIDFLTRYGTPILVVLALAAGSFWGYDKFKKNQRAKIDEAFTELTLTSESANPSPETLKRVADDFGSVKAVGILARLDAADAYMLAVRKGVQTGKELKDDGALEKPEDALTDAERMEYLNQAGELYKAAYEQSASNPSRMPLTLGGLFGMAAVAESKQDYAGAKARYEEIVHLTENTTFSRNALLAKHRMEQLGALKDLPKIYTRAEIPKAEQPEQSLPFNVPPGVTVEPVSGPPGAPAGPPAPPTPTPQPSPTPAPVAPAPAPTTTPPK